MRRPTTPSLVVLALLSWAATSTAAPKPKPGGPPPACGLKALPMAQGNTWTYKSGAQTVVIKVIEVGQGKDFAGKPATTIVTEETYNGRTVKATHSCTAAGLLVSLDSFFFSGEPGGGMGTTMNVTDRDKVTILPDAEMVTDQGWIESVKADATRTDGTGGNMQHAPGKIEVERHVSIKGDEKVMIALGEFATQKIVFELRGRGLVEDQKVEIPIKRPATMWLSKGIGFIKVEDAFEKTWELAESNVLPK